MAVTIKSEREIELMREAGKILAKTHNELEKALKPGMTTWDIAIWERRSSAATDVSPPSKIIADTRLLSVYLSIMRWFMEFQVKNA